jgi:Asp-tRNA(Asn)/Glu-tRNA(Gln) amidotransferase A subunit family amidase
MPRSGWTGKARSRRPALPMRCAPRAARCTACRTEQMALGISINTRPFNYLGLPAMSIPCGFDPNGLPIGLQISGRPFAEAAVLKAADAYQRDTDWHARRPAIPAV